MATAQGSTIHPLHSPGKLVQKHVLRITLEALIRTEWSTFRDSLVTTGASSGKLHSSEPAGSNDLYVTRKIHTDIGNIRVQFPDHPTLKFRSSLLDKRQRSLVHPSTTLLPLPFLIGDELQAALGRVLHREVDAECVARFNGALCERFTAWQSSRLDAHPHRVYLGTFAPCPAGTPPTPALLDYCIVSNSQGATSVAGIWDSDTTPERWRAILIELGSRGMRQTEHVEGDGSPELAPFIAHFPDALEGCDIGLPTPTDEELDSLAEQRECAELCLNDPEPELDVALSRGATPSPSSNPYAPPPSPLSVGGTAWASLMIIGLVLATGSYYLLRSGIPSVDAPVHSPSTEARASMAPMSAAPRALEVSTDELLQLIHDPSAPDALLFEALMNVATRASSDAAAALKRAAAHESYRVRIQAIKAMASAVAHHPNEFHDTLVTLLDDSDFIVRGFAAKALGRIGTLHALTALEKHRFKEENQRVLAVIDDVLVTGHLASR